MGYRAHSHTTIDKNLMASDQAALARCQEQHRSCHLVRFPQVPKRHASVEYLGHRSYPTVTPASANATEPRTMPVEWLGLIEQVGHHIL